MVYDNFPIEEDYFWVHPIFRHIFQQNSICESLFCLTIFLVNQGPSDQDRLQLQVVGTETFEPWAERIHYNVHVYLVAHPT